MNFFQNCPNCEARSWIKLIEKIYFKVSRPGTWVVQGKHFSYESNCCLLKSAENSLLQEIAYSFTKLLKIWRSLLWLQVQRTTLLCKTTSVKCYCNSDCVPICKTEVITNPLRVWHKMFELRVSSGVDQVGHWWTARTHHASEHPLASLTPESMVLILGLVPAILGIRITTNMIFAFCPPVYYRVLLLLHSCFILLATLAHSRKNNLL